MNHLLDDEDDFAGQPNHRELTLSTSAILGIFLGLSLVCGLFFALGYNMGHKVEQPSLAAASDATASAGPSTNFNSFKPAAGSAAGGTPLPATAPLPSTPAVSSNKVSAAGADPSPSSRTSAAPETAQAQNEEPPSAKPSAPTQAATPVPAPAHPAPVAEPATGSFFVQVAAVSHQEDAELLVGALKGKGYAVAARSEPQDKLVHIQVGPFSNRRDAETMRQKLLNDGYNAIVK